MAQTNIILALLGALLIALPLLPPARSHLLRMLRKSWPRSAIKQRHGELTVLDAAALLTPVMLISSLWAPIPPFILTLGFGAVLLTLIVFDLRYRWLPDQLTLPLIAIGLLVGTLVGPGFWLTLAASVGAGGSAWLIGETFYRLRGVDGLGGGDVKLMAAIGAWCGPELTPLVIAAAALSALAIEITVQYARQGRLDPTRRIPFGVYLAAALWLMWLAQPSLG
jgi:prepilin signal peptidase PulO-like enzyme (type II secretory pathway)